MSTMEARRAFFASTTATGPTDNGDPNRQTAIAQQMERKQLELMEAKRQEERLLAEAERRSGSLTDGNTP